MPFDAAALGAVENALSDSFAYHNALDQFFIRSGLSRSLLADARKLADDRTVNSNREYRRSPKRFVVQEVLNKLTSLGDEGDRIVASLITSLIKGTFPEATDAATSAILELRSRQEDDAAQKRRAREEEQAELKRIRETEERKQSSRLIEAQKQRDKLRDEFTSLLGETNAQRRGYLLETFLNNLFDFEGLDPRRSFKLVGEQIDGSFLWRSRVHLVEAKWVRDPVAGADFGQSIYKIEGKTADTRGIYISVNGYSVDALRGLNGKGALKFICLDGTHLMRVLSGGDELPELLNKLWRHADETGEAYLPANRLG